MNEADGTGGIEAAPEGDEGPGKRPAVRLRAGRSKRLRRGHPWVYSNEIEMDDATRGLAPGRCVDLVDAGGERLGVAFFNPHALIAARLLARDPGQRIDEGFLAQRLEAALGLRERLYDAPYYRLAHGDADGLPGLAADRYGGIVSVQLNGAGMERMAPALLAALAKTLRPAGVVLRRDGRARASEGLAREEAIVEGAVESPVPLEEAGVPMLADPVAGQKTGWYFDQRDNRDFIAALRPGRRVLDLYCHSGAFALRAAAAGAQAVLGIDSARPALDLAARSAQAAGVADRIRFERADIFRWLPAMAEEDARYDLVIADPPAFATSRKELTRALRAHRKLARLAGGLVAPEGFLALACCAHQVALGSFLEAVAKGLGDLGRTARMVRTAGAGADHPVHPALPESAYLKFLVVALDR